MLNFARQRIKKDTTGLSGNPPHHSSTGAAPSGTMEVPGHADTAHGLGEAVTPTSSPAKRPRRPMLVTLGITATVILSLFSVSVLYYKWYRLGDTSSMIIVWGESSWEGATVTISGSDLPTGSISKVFEPDDNGVIRFHVPPGSYFARVHRDGQTLKQIPSSRPLRAHETWWPFRAPPAATQAAAAQ